jgi:putative transposase
MRKTYKFRLYPTKQNIQKLLLTLDKCRFVYNYLLEQKSKTKMNRYELSTLLTKLKNEIPELKKVHSKPLQYENSRLNSNIIALNRMKKNGRKIGKLRFKGKNWFKTFTYSQHGFKIIRRNTIHDLLMLSKIGSIPMVMHRDIQGKIKQVTIKHEPTGKWFASIVAETNDEILPTKNKNVVGIDLGLDDYVYDSDGTHTKAPKIFNNSIEKIRKEQRRLSRKKLGSNNRIKQRIKVARIHEKINNQRDDFLHKLSTNYVNKYGFIAVEDLQISNMVKNPYLSRSIMDASWSKFIQMLEYKAESAGVQVMKVEPRYTTQKCSNCGNIVKKSLSQRTHKCECGLILPRDYNSAINILNIGLDKPEYTPVEIEPLCINHA